MLAAHHKKIAALFVPSAATIAISLVIVLPGGATSAGPWVGPPSAANELGALASTPPVDRVPAAVVRAEAYMPDRVQAGAAQSERVRRLMTGVGINAVDLYAFPTDTGAACLVVTETAFPGMCVDRFDGRQPIAFAIYNGVGAPTTVVGLAPNPVTGVDVVWQEVAHRARLSNNAVFYQSSDPALQDSDVPFNGIEALVIHYRGGATVTRTFGRTSH
jgi:hypothetical protein